MSIRRRRWILTIDIAAERLSHVESQWQDARQKLPELKPIEIPVEHDHWDWRSKAPFVRRGQLRVLAVSCLGSVQGVMAISTHDSRLELGKRLIYVSYVETAPWNLPGLVEGPYLMGIGTALMAAAIRLSIEQGHEGRIGLHSLPWVEKFYERKIRMTRIPGYENDEGLVYFEKEARDAQRWLEEQES